MVIRKDNSTDNEFSTPVKKTSTKGKISIPKATLRNVQGGFDGKVYTFAYRKSTIFRSKIKNQNEAVGSIIVSISLKKKVEGNPAVRIKFEKKIESDGVSCNYWDTVRELWKGKNRRRGFWNDTGCRVNGTDGDEVTCACDHFTNFALLLSVEGVEVPKELNILATIGNAISLVALFFTILAHASIKKLKESLPSKILICFSIALSFLLLFLLVEEHVALTAKVPCQVIAGLVHFSMLATFTWTSVNALALYQAIVKVFNARDNTKFMIRASVFAWGAPAVIVILNGAVKPGSLGRFTDRGNVCFPQGPSMLYGGILPIAIILLLNAIIFITIMVSLHRKPEVAGRKRDIKKQTRIAVCCIVLLGIAWIFGLLVSIKDASLVFQILFCVFNAFQGLAILILYTLQNPNVQAELKTWFGCGSTTNVSGPSNQDKTQKTNVPSVASSNDYSKKEILNPSSEYTDVGLQNMGAQLKELPTYDGCLNAYDEDNYTALESWVDNPIYQSIEEFDEPTSQFQQTQPPPRPTPQLPQRQPPPPPVASPNTTASVC